MIEKKDYKRAKRVKILSIEKLSITVLESLQNTPLDSGNGLLSNLLDRRSFIATDWKHPVKRGCANIIICVAQ